MNGLPVVPLGRTGLTVSRLGLGASGLGGMFAHVEEDAADALVTTALDLGITYLDVAPLYGHGTAERRLGRVLRGRDRSSYVLSTKVGRLIRERAGADTGIFVDAPPSDAVVDFSRDGVLRSLDESRTRLGVDAVDVVYVHDPDEHRSAALGAAWPALVELREQGVVAGIGVGTNSAATAAWFVERADVDVLLLANQYTLLDRAGADLLDRAGERGVAVVAAGVFGSGLLADPRPGARYRYEIAPVDAVTRAEHLAAVCARHGVPLGVAAMRFPLTHPAVGAVLVGAADAAQVRTNVEWFRQPVPDQLWEEVRRTA